MLVRYDVNNVCAYPTRQRVCVCVLRVRRAEDHSENVRSMD